MPISPQSILILSNASGYGGAQRSLEKMVTELALDHTIHLFAENVLHLQALENIQNSNLFTHKLHQGKSWWIMLLNLLIIVRITLQIQPTIALSNTNKGALFLGLLRRLGVIRKAKRFVFIRDYQWVNQKAIWKLLRPTTLLIPSQALHDRPGFLPSWPTHIIPNFTDLPTLTEDKPKQPLVVCLAMISPWKGIEYLVQGFAIALKQNPELKLAIVGKIIHQDYFQQIQSMISELGIARHVEFHPFVPNPQEYYEQAMMVVNSSISELGGPETFGRTIIEAWAFECPVISFDCGGPHYIIDSGINGFLVPEKNIEMLGERIHQLAQNKDLRLKLGRNGRAKVKNQYHKSVVLKQLNNVLFPP